jgi:hypothetical protein
MGDVNFLRDVIRAGSELPITESVLTVVAGMIVYDTKNCAVLWPGLAKAVVVLLRPRMSRLP